MSWILTSSPILGHLLKGLKLLREANYKMYKLSRYMMYECFISNGLLNINISQKSRIALFKDVLDFYLQPYQGIGIMM